MTLERYFRDQLREKQLFRQIGSWWETSKGKGKSQNEIDIVAIYTDNKKVLVAEVKRQGKNFKPELFEEKVNAIRTKLFFKYKMALYIILCKCRIRDSAMSLVISLLLIL